MIHVAIGLIAVASMLAGCSKADDTSASSGAPAAVRLSRHIVAISRIVTLRLVTPEGIGGSGPELEP